MATGVDAKLLKSTRFPSEFNQKVDMQKVNLQVMKKWIAGRISEILGNEDDVVIELCFNLIEGSRYPDIKSLQIQLTGFLDKDTSTFCKELWKLCLSAQSSPQGVPKELLEAKKQELIQEKIEADRAAEEARQRREDTERRDRELANTRDRERRDRFRGRGDGWRGGRRGDHNSDGGRRGGFHRGDTVILATHSVVGIATFPAVVGEAGMTAADGPPRDPGPDRTPAVTHHAPHREAYLPSHHADLVIVPPARKDVGFLERDQRAEGRGTIKESGFDLLAVVTQSAIWMKREGGGILGDGPPAPLLYPDRLRGAHPVPITPTRLPLNGDATPRHLLHPPALIPPTVAAGIRAAGLRKGPHVAPRVLEGGEGVTGAGLPLTHLATAEAGAQPNVLAIPDPPRAASRDHLQARGLVPVHDTEVLL
ncbi:hypothetical protein jhhlp_002372 [Lomentospora prolificans]|uniref:PWI domain-containing protein n=1 Tax=Lomentospora prolificans TaxID=41688 RepID=A0A2N3NDY8_9PEZI|nr:hypothetical protein jhhlp_002372 [Lomentospora prolificans]